MQANEPKEWMYSDSLLEKFPKNRQYISSFFSTFLGTIKEAVYIPEFEDLKIS